MFEKLFDFSFQRSRKQAIGFYIVWLLAGSLLTAVVVEIYIRFNGSEPLPKGLDFAGAVRALQGISGAVVPSFIFLFSTVMASLIVRAKNAYNRVGMTCVFLAAILSVTGAILSLIPVAYLTTLPKSSS